MALSKGISMKNGATGLSKGVSLRKPAPAPKKYNTPEIPIGGYNPAQVAGSYQGASHPDMNFDGGLDAYGGPTAEAGQTTIT